MRLILHMLKSLVHVVLLLKNVVVLEECAVFKQETINHLRYLKVHR